MVGGGTAGQAQNDVGQRTVFTEADGIFSHRVGSLEIFTLVEIQGPASADMLLGADDAMERHLSETGFIMATNAFLVKTPNQNILLDTGSGEDVAILERMRALGLEPANIDAVLITHLHSDHFGGLRVGGVEGDGQAVFSNARIYISAKELEHFTKVAPDQTVLDILALYEGRVDTFEQSQLGSPPNPLFSGISPVSNFGHTPGHTVFMIESGSERLIVAGDFLHIALIQFPNPEISSVFDTDPVAAAVSRRQILEYAAVNNIPIGSIHIAYPGIGKVEIEGSGFRLVPKR